MRSNFVSFLFYDFNEARNNKAENCSQPKGQGEGKLKLYVGNWGEGEQPQAKLSFWATSRLREVFA